MASSGDIGISKEAQLAGLIPRPARQGRTGGALDVSSPGRLVAGPGLASLSEVAASLLGWRPRAGSPAVSGAGGFQVELRLDDSVPRTPATAAGPGGRDEAYRLVVDDSGIRCLGRTAAGVLRAVGTASQLLADADSLPCQVIDDFPRFGWRGLMVDVARSFRTPQELREIVDLCALYKLNMLHLHLTDNEAWRLEIPGRAELAAPEVSPAGPGSYPMAEFADLQDYAAERLVTIVPEVDLPGHCAALVRAFPSLARHPRPAWLASHIPYSGPLDLADGQTRGVVREIIAAVARQTRGPFVHIGADEAFGAAQPAFVAAVRELRAMVREAGKEPVAWQEAARAGGAARDIVQHWVNLAMTGLPASEAELAARPELSGAGLTWPVADALRRHFEPSDDDVRRALADGARVLLSPQSHLYLDRPYDLAVAPAGQRDLAARLGFPLYQRQDVRSAAAWDPLAAGVPAESIAGVEAAIWGETVGSFVDLTALLLPRLAAVAESAWSPRPAAWPDLRERLATHAPLWRARGWAYLASTEIDWR
jgi:hexosaminidase